MFPFQSFASRIVFLMAVAGCSPALVDDVEGGGGESGGEDRNAGGAGLEGGAAGNAGQGGVTQSGGGNMPKAGGSAGNTAASGGGGGDGIGAGGMAGASVIGGPCPTAPPFNESDLDIVTRCTRPLVAAVGNGLRRAFSYDGQTWFGDVWFPSGGDENENSHRDVAIGNGLIVIVGDGGILTSRDAGITFTRKDTGRSLHNSAVVFFQGAFWVVAQGGVHTSTNGVDWKSWQESDTLPGGLRASFGAQDGATDGKQALFISGSSYRIWDGKMWSQGTIPGRGIDCVTFGNGRFAGVSSFSGSSAVSTNGTTWSGDSSGTDLRFDSIVWNGKEFFASASKYDGNGQTSPDGLRWTRHKMNTSIGPVVRLGDLYVAATGATLYRSTDARVWTLPHVAAGGNNDWGFGSMTTGVVLKGASP